MPVKLPPLRLSPKASPFDLSATLADSWVRAGIRTQSSGNRLSDTSRRLDDQPEVSPNLHLTRKSGFGRYCQVVHLAGGHVVVGKVGVSIGPGPQEGMQPSHCFSQKNRHVGLAS